MKLLRSLIKSSLLFLSLCSSVIYLSAEETVIPGWDVFSGTTISGSEFLFPSSADAWAGFASQDSTPTWKPFTFSVDGALTVSASVPSGGSATLRFVFERLPYDANGNAAADTLPKVAFSDGNDYVDVTFSGDAEQEQVIVIPQQGANTFSSFVMTILERDVAVNITEVKIQDDAGSDAGDGGDDSGSSDYVAGESGSTQIENSYWNAFHGATNESGLLTIPATNAPGQPGYTPGSPIVQAYAGFGNIKPETTPFTFSSDGTITFEASVPGGGQADVHFKFEANPYPGHIPWIQTDSVTVSGDQTQIYTVSVPSNKSWNYQTYNSFLFYIEDRDVSVQLGDVTVQDDAYAVDSQPENGVRFVFQNRPHPNNDLELTTPWIAIDDFSSSNFSVSIPAYNGEYVGMNPSLTSDLTFNNVLMYLAGKGQPVVVRDVEIEIGSTTYGGSGDDSLLFGNTWSGSQLKEDLLTYYVADTASTNGAGYAISGTPLGADGVALDQPITINFIGALSNESFEDPAIYNGEVAFGDDGTINTSLNSEAGTEADPKRWSGHVSWFNLESDGSKGSNVNSQAWGDIAHLPATWSDVNGDSVLTLKPNTFSWSAWSDPDATDGKYYVESALQLAGVYPSPEDGTLSKLAGKAVNFSGDVISNDLLEKYTVTAFIKCIDTSIVDADPVVAEDSVVLDSTGTFVLSVNMESSDTIQPVLGFITAGQNANPEAFTGEIQIKDLVANYTDINPIKDASFAKTYRTDYANYWTAETGTTATFSILDGNGSIPGQLSIFNPSGGERGTKFVGSNNNSPDDLSAFGMEAGNTYGVSFYMKKQLGTDMGLVQFEFYDDNSLISSEPSDPTQDVHAVNTNTWTQYTQSITVPNSATRAILRIYGGGSGSYIHYDDVLVTFESANNTFSNWASSNGLTGSDANFNSDPDADGIPNGLENFLGTNPNSASSGMSDVGISSGTLSMQHSKNSNGASDVSAEYFWSTDLSTWNDSGATVNGTTVVIGTQDDSPTEGTTTATATASGSDTDSIFIKVSVSNE